MPVHNSDVAAVLNHIAELLAIEEANPYRVRAYRNAARTVQDLPRRLEEMLKEGENLSQLPGIGKDLAGKIEEIVKTGESPLLKALQKETPPQLAEVMKLEGVGPKRAKVLHQKLGVETLQGLEKVAQQGRIRKLSGFGKKTEENILAALERYQGREQRMKLAQAEAIAEPLVDYFQSVPGVKKVVIAGSYRRRKETVGDLDILVTCKKGSKVMDRFVAYEDVKDVISKGSTRSTVRLRSDLRVDVRVVPEVCYGAALHYFTGNKAHNIAVRRMGQQKKLKINEYGVFKGDKRIAGQTEEEVYR
jgi:DNA polymerase (family 10)